MCLDDMSKEQVINLNIPTGIPLVYELDDALKPVKNSYLGDPETIQTAMASAASLKQTTNRKGVLC